MLDVMLVGSIVLCSAALLLWRLARWLRNAKRRDRANSNAVCASCPGCVEGVGQRSDTTSTAGETPMPPRRRGDMGPGALLVLCMLGTALTAPRTWAADTIETFDAGAADAEMYMGLDGLGLRDHEKTLLGDMLLGYGIINRLSIFAGATLQSDEFFSNGQTSFQVGLFGTPLDTDHVDIDLLFAISMGGARLDGLRFSPSVELNLDSRPDMSGLGAYVRGGVPVFGRKRGGVAGGSSTHTETAADVQFTFGGYWTIAETHQLLLEYGMTFHPSPEDAQHGTEFGAAALGYNVVLSDAIELINQVSVDIPQEGERVAVGVLLGLIATLGLR